MWWRRALPAAISVGLIAWLASRISLSELARAAAVLPWKLLGPMTVALVIALYFWDALCLVTVFSTGGKAFTCTAMLRARGKSYLVGAWNQGLGQAAVAWNVAKARRTSFRAALMGSIILSWHEGVILSTAALAGATWLGEPRLTQARNFSALLLTALLAAALILQSLPAKGRLWIQQRPWGQTLAAWSFGRSVRLVALRLVYFGIVGVYVPTALWLCGQPIGPATALAVVPLVLLATILPSASGLGARETALYLLLPSIRPDVLVAVGVIWSLGMIVVRLLIGLGWLWFDPGAPESEPGENEREGTVRGQGHDANLDGATPTRSGVNLQTGF
jgi:hypothetical protein